MGLLCVSDQATLSDLGRGRKPSHPTRSRQQLNRERERALRISAGTGPTGPSVLLGGQGAGTGPTGPSVLLGGPGAGTGPTGPSVLPAEQRLSKPVETAVPQRRPSAGPPDAQTKDREPPEKPLVKGEQGEAVVKELETQEVEMLVFPVFSTSL